MAELCGCELFPNGLMAKPCDEHATAYAERERLDDYLDAMEYLLDNESEGR